MPSLDHVVLQVPGSEEGSVTDITGELLLPPVVVLLPQGDLEGLLEAGGVIVFLPQGDLQLEGLLEGGAVAG